jgi:hypothetical protein
MTDHFEPRAPVSTSRLSRRWRDVGLLLAIVGALGVGYLQLRAEQPIARETVVGAYQSETTARTAIGTTQRILKLRLADGTLVDALVPGALTVKPGDEVTVERLTLASGLVEYRAVPTVKTGR